MRKKQLLSNFSYKTSPEMMAEEESNDAGVNLKDLETKRRIKVADNQKKVTKLRNFCRRKQVIYQYIHIIAKNNVYNK